jgi:hypothetical protein
MTLKLFAVTFTHDKTIVHRNIDPAAFNKFNEELSDDVTKPWSIVEKGFISYADAEERATCSLVRNGEYSAKISEYSVAPEEQYIIRKDEGLTIVDNMDPTYLMATTAYHLMGDISREKPDLCTVHAEDADNYYGSWVLGMGFFGVQFPKATTRLPTEEEKVYWESQHIVMFGSQSGTKSYDLPPIKFK